MRCLALKSQLSLALVWVLSGPVMSIDASQLLSQLKLVGLDHCRSADDKTMAETIPEPRLSKYVSAEVRRRLVVVG
jgi:hypothetical protein